MSPQLKAMTIYMEAMAENDIQVRRTKILALAQNHGVNTEGITTTDTKHWPHMYDKVFSAIKTPPGTSTDEEKIANALDEALDFQVKSSHNLRESIRRKRNNLRLNFSDIIIKNQTKWIMAISLLAIALTVFILIAQNNHNGT